MNLLMDINVSFQNSLVGLATMVYSYLDSPLTIEQIEKKIKQSFCELHIVPKFYFSDILDSLILLYSLGKIELNTNGEVYKK